MGRVIYMHKEYKVIQLGPASFLVVNSKGGEECHAHFDRQPICHRLISMVTKKIVPDNDHLKESAWRITLDPYYKQRLEAQMVKHHKAFYKPQPHHKRRSGQ